MPAEYPGARGTGEVVLDSYGVDPRGIGANRHVIIDALDRRPLPLSVEVVIEPAPESREPRCGAVCQALCRTRTGDPFLTMEVLYQLS